MRHVRFDRWWSWCLRTLCALGMAAGLSSCLDIEQSLVLNPDGSGKVTLTTALAVPSFDGLAGFGQESGGDTPKKLKPREQAREMAVELLRAEGIEAWSDVTYGVSKDGKTRASATGYFRDVTKVRLSNPLKNDRSRDDLGVSKNADGHWVIEQRLDENASAAESPAPPAGGTGKPIPPPALTDEEVQDKLDEERQQWAGMKSFLSAFFEHLRIASTVQGGGTIVETTGFEKKDERTAVLEFTGKMLLERMDALLQDDEKAKALIKQGLNPTDSDGGPGDIFNLAFGSENTMQVTLKPGTPAFDYATALAQAKAGESAELRSLLEQSRQPSAQHGLPGLLKPELEDGRDNASDPDADDRDEESRPAPPVRKRPRQID